MQDDRTLRPRRCTHDGNGQPPLQIVPYLIQAGFYGVARLGVFKFNAGLISALVERWRPETHTFHMPQGECIITLEDVAVQLGLPCGGAPVIGPTAWDYKYMCQVLLGVVPPDDKIDGQRLSMSWLMQAFNDIPLDASDHYLQCYTRAYILRLIGGYLMVDKSSTYCYLMYLPLLANLSTCRGYSWGSEVLSFLYRELCKGTQHQTHDIGGCLTLLHLWAWDRFPKLAPQMPAAADPHLNMYPLMPPLGFR